ncbi:MAG: hypothetical protein JWP19_1121 [Rhodoglobus sp.]|nr:hypothetical protein [Rhodoglobus sp.]
MNNWGQLAVFDLETTGVDVESARIVSACIAVLAADGSVIERWDWLADPGINIPDGAAAVHGITTERARAEGRAAEIVIAEIAQALRVLFALGMPLVVYNAPYDLTLLDRECRRHRLRPLEVFSPVIDPLVIDKAVDRYRKGKRTLEVTAELYGVALDDAHDAGSDAIAAGRVAQALGAAYPDELDVTLPDLHGRQEVWYAEQAASFQDFIRTAKGDESYVADSAWPMRPVVDPSTFLDTQPIPAPAPRPSLTVPVIDLDAFERGGTAVIPPELGGLEQPRSTDADAAAEAEQAIAPFAVEQVVVIEQRVVAENVVVAENAVIADDAIVAESVTTVAPPSIPEQPPLIEPDFFAAHAATPEHPQHASRPAILRIAAGIITDPAGRTLLVRKRGTTAFMQAGGKIEHGESALDALARELTEEIGLELDPDNTEYLGSFRALAANEPDTVIRAEVFALLVAHELVPSGEIEELLWIESGEPSGIELAPLTRDTILPLWAERRSALF